MTGDPPSTSDPDDGSFWHRFLDGRTAAQRLLIALGAAAGALLAIAGLASAVARLVDSDGGSSQGARSDGVAVIENQSREADEFVRELLSHDDGPPVQLDHQVLGRPGGGDVTLEYACSQETGCSSVRIQDAEVTFAVIPGGVWFEGCYRVVQDGPGYAAQGLDIELTFAGTTCPG